jgi:hypothetical protein
LFSSKKGGDDEERNIRFSPSNSMDSEQSPTVGGFSQFDDEQRDTGHSSDESPPRSPEQQQEDLLDFNF